MKAGRNEDLTEKIIVARSYFDERLAALFVQTANQYKCKITLNTDNKTTNAKSIMGVISFGIEKGMQAVIRAEGENETFAVDALGQLF